MMYNALPRDERETGKQVALRGIAVHSQNDALPLATPKKDIDIRHTHTTVYCNSKQLFMWAHLGQDQARVSLL